jgi:sugar phosphate isomerase/epimerase
MPITGSMKERIAVVAAAFSDDPRILPELARSAGFAGVLFDAIGPSLRFDELSATGRRDFGRHLAGHGIALVGLQCQLGRDGLGRGADVDRILSEMRRLMEAARDIASPLICLDLGPLPAAPKPAAASKPTVTKESAGRIILPDIAAAPSEAPAGDQPSADPASDAQVLAALSEIGSLADRMRRVVAMRATQATIDSLGYWLARVSCPWFGVDLDPVALLGEPSDGQAAFSRIGPLVRHVRGRDAVRGAGQHKSSIVGHGDVGWPRLLTLLDEAGYSGWITIDPMDLREREAGAIAGLKQLVAWLK